MELSVNEDGAAAAIVFKTVADPFIGKLSYVKVISGKLSTDSQLVNMRTGNVERIGKTVMMVGKKQVDVKYIGAGDIGAIPKLTATNTGDTLCSPTRKVTLEGVEYPTPTLSMAIVPAKKGEEDKIAQGMMRLSEEDPTLQFSTNNETHEMIVSGLGEQHLDVAVSKLKSKFGVDITLKKPKVPYRETIRKTVQVQGRHKKQTGGHGQFGDVWIEFSPCDSEGLEFGERVVGGSVPKGFFPRGGKGLRECIQKGPLAGYPVVGLSAVLYDGSYHPWTPRKCPLRRRRLWPTKPACPGQPCAAGAHRPPEGHCAGRQHGRCDGRGEQAPGPCAGHGACRGRPAGPWRPRSPWRRCTTLPPSSANATQAGAAYLHLRAVRGGSSNVAQKVIEESKAEENA